MSGSLTVSIELELGWGMHDQQEYSHLSEDRYMEGEALRKLLAIADKHAVPISFDIVGHLFEKKCSGVHEGPYPNGWWTADPGSGPDQNPLFYAPDLITAIREATVDHEICTHTYSHTLYDKMGPDILAAELEHVKTLHEDWELPKPTSIVFPRHQSNHYDILADFGINTVRHPISGYGIEASNPFRKLWWLLNRDHPITQIQQRDDLLITPCTPHPSLTTGTLPNGQNSPHPVFRVIPARLRQRLHRQYLQSAVDNTVTSECHLHLWTHLYNMSNRFQFPVVRQAIEYISKVRDESDLTVHRMCDLQ